MAGRASQDVTSLPPRSGRGRRALRWPRGAARSLVHEGTPGTRCWPIWPSLGNTRGLSCSRPLPTRVGLADCRPSDREQASAFTGADAASDPLRSASRWRGPNAYDLIGSSRIARWAACEAPSYRGCSSMVELQPSKLAVRVRFPSPAPCAAAIPGHSRPAIPVRNRPQDR